MIICWRIVFESWFDTQTINGLSHVNGRFNFCGRSIGLGLDEFYFGLFVGYECWLWWWGGMYRLSFKWSVCCGGSRVFGYSRRSVHGVKIVAIVCGVATTTVAADWWSVKIFRTLKAL